jgi:hypothetical protein
LRGDGTGAFHPVDSGIVAYGEQRGTAVCDFDQDGRVDLVVTENGAATKLYRNIGEKRGLRVRLHGPPGNLSGTGASVRLKFGKGWGPAREVHAGSGYWSQDSAVLVLGFQESPGEVEVRWPNGRVTRKSFSQSEREIEINFE